MRRKSPAQPLCLNWSVRMFTVRFARRQLAQTGSLSLDAQMAPPKSSAINKSDLLPITLWFRQHLQGAGAAVPEVEVKTAAPTLKE